MAARSLPVFKLVLRDRFEVLTGAGGSVFNSSIFCWRLDTVPNSFSFSLAVFLATSIASLAEETIVLSLSRAFEVVLLPLAGFGFSVLLASVVLISGLTSVTNLVELDLGAFELSFCRVFSPEPSLLIDLAGFLFLLDCDLETLVSLLLVVVVSTSPLAGVVPLLA